MRIRFRFTKNRKQDVLRYVVALAFFFLLITFFWNQSSTPLSPLKSGYQGYIMQGRLANNIITPEGIAFLKKYLETHTRPTINPVTIVRHHRNMSARSTDYEFVLGIRPVDEDTAIREYGIYQRGRIVFLQVEPVGIDRVLTADFSAGELETMLLPYVDGTFEVQ